jgi:hypothetical protein
MHIALRRTRRWAAALLTVVSATSLASAPAHAARLSPGPTVEIHGLTGPHVGPEGEREWWLRLTAHDPDGIIWEIEVTWGDRSVSWATTFCVQGSTPGMPAPMTIPHSYPAPGRYVARVHAQSYDQCPFEGPASDQVSRTYTARLTAAG